MRKLKKGYGNVRIVEINASYRKYTFMEDCDMSCDFGNIGEFVDKLHSTKSHLKSIPEVLRHLKFILFEKIWL